MSNIALVVNTISKNKDVWGMFFDQISEHVPSSLFTKKYIFVDPLAKDLPEEYEVLYYDTNKKYRDQFLSCIERVEEEYCIYISEDYILYDDVQTDLIEKYKNLLEKNGHLSFIRFVKGGVVDKGFPRFRNFEDLFEMHHSVPYFYTNQAAIWRTRDLEKIHRHGPNLHIANLDYENSFEYQATKTCQELDIQGLFCYHGESKRGMYHYDCDVFPHISTALVKGKWNISEYKDELMPLIEKYNIDIHTRGTY
tara:strand:- start:2 stop:757 length:756 start_codon:yes stop_codon:yes gene_type:complete